MSGLVRQVTKLNFATTEWYVALCSSDSSGLSGEDSNSCSMAGDLGTVFGMSKCPVALTLLVDDHACLVDEDVWGFGEVHYHSEVVVDLSCSDLQLPEGHDYSFCM